MFGWIFWAYSHVIVDCVITFGLFKLLSNLCDFYVVMYYEVITEEKDMILYKFKPIL